MTIFCKFLQSVTDIWATEACASTKRRASDHYSGWRLCAPLAEAGASLERRGASVQRRAPLYMRAHLCHNFLCLSDRHVRPCT